MFGERNTRSYVYETVTACPPNDHTLLRQFAVVQLPPLAVDGDDPHYVLISRGWR